MGKNKDVREAVEKEFLFDPLVDAANITVKCMNGDVALNGTVPSYPQYLEAAKAARRIAGVTSVHNHLEVQLPPECYRDDAMLTTVANNTLAANSTIPDGVEAMSRNGNLKLTGTVNYGYQRAAAESAVAGLTGVRRVNDKIEVVYDTDPADITQHVQDALARHALIPDDSDVAADTFGSAVRLTGHVRTWAEHDAVVSATWMANGVTEVIDELEVMS